jgi:hypothetical protein
LPVAAVAGTAETREGRMTTTRQRNRQPTHTLSACLTGELRARFAPRRAAYVAAVLTAEELAVISDLSDALIFARIKRMSEERLKRFDDLVPTDETQVRFYQSLQLRWLHDEEYLLGTRLGRRPTQRELFVDFMNHRNGRRFRAYFAMKHPGRMKPKRTSAK